MMKALLLATVQLPRATCPGPYNDETTAVSNGVVLAHDFSRSVIYGVLNYRYCKKQTEASCFDGSCCISSPAQASPSTSMHAQKPRRVR